MLIIRVGVLHVYREDDGVRFTIPTIHSSTIVTDAEAYEVAKALTKLLKPKRGKQ